MITNVDFKKEYIEAKNADCVTEIKTELIEENGTKGLDDYKAIETFIQEMKSRGVRMVCAFNASGKPDNHFCTLNNLPDFCSFENDELSKQSRIDNALTNMHLIDAFFQQIFKITGLPQEVTLQEFKHYFDFLFKFAIELDIRRETGEYPQTIKEAIGKL